MILLNLEVRSKNLHKCFLGYIEFIIMSLLLQEMSGLLDLSESL